MNFPQRLIDGYTAFAGGRLAREQDRYRELGERGQAPEIMVIGCCDSRVSPEVIFDAGPRFRRDIDDGFILVFK